MKRISLEEAENYQPYKRTPLSGDPDFYAIEVDKDGWENTYYYTKHNRVHSDLENEGSEYVYVLKNEYMPGLLKIGYTYNTPESRAVQLFKTGVPDMFKVVYRCKCFNGMRIERAVHQQLKKYRIREDREFFKVKLEEAIQTIEQMKEQYG